MLSLTHVLYLGTSGEMSLPEDKAAADRKAAEEKMEIERGVRLLDTSTDDISSQDGKRTRVDSLSSHFIRVCGLGQSEVFETDDSNLPPPPARCRCLPQS